MARDEARGCSYWCGRGDSNPHGLTPNGFSYQLRLSPPRLRPTGFGAVRGLDYPFTVARFLALGAARLVSTPSLPECSFGQGLARDRQNGCVTRLKLSPNLSSSTPAVSSGALNGWLKSVASTGSATPALHSNKQNTALNCNQNFYSANRFSTVTGSLFFLRTRRTLMAAVLRLVLICEA